MNVYLYQNNTEKILKNIYIGEYKGWTPGSNTLAYLPLSSDTADHSGRGLSVTTQGTVSKDSNGYLFNGGVLTTSNITVPTNLTLSLWGKFIEQSYTSNRVPVCLYYGTSAPYAIAEVIVGGSSDTDLTIRDKIAFLGSNTTATNKVAISNYTMTNWNNFIGVYDGSAMVLYINGVQVASNSLSSLTYGSYPLHIGDWYYNSGQVGRLYISEVIVENKARTAQEISDYYNQTKSNYGL